MAAKKPPQLHLGKTKARPGAMTFKLVDYINKKALPKPPAQFGQRTAWFPPIGACSATTITATASGPAPRTKP